MKKILLLSGLLLCLSVSFAQTDNAARYAAVITGAELKKQLTVIAGDEMEGRETGTEGQRKAAAYIESQFKTIGLQPPKPLNGYQQLFPLYRDSMASSIVKINNRELNYGTDYYVPVISNDNKR